MRPRTLSRDALVGAAVKIADEEGLSAVTARRLAAALEVTPSALYRHIDSKEELLDLMLASVLDEVEVPARDDPNSPTDHIVAVLSAQRQSLRRHPGVQLLFASRAVLTPAALRVSEAVVSELLAAGLSPAEATRAYAALSSYLLGDVLIDRGRTTTMASGGTPDRIRDVLRRLPGDEFPSIVATADHWVEDRPDEAFDVGLRRQLTAILQT